MHSPKFDRVIRFFVTTFSKIFTDLFWGIPLWRHNELSNFFALLGSTHPTDSIDVWFVHIHQEMAEQCSIQARNAKKKEIGLVFTPLSWHRSWLYVLCVARNKLCLKAFSRRSDQDFCIWAFLSSFLLHKVKVLVIFPQNYIFKHQPNAQIIVMLWLWSRGQWKESDGEVKAGW